MLRIGQVETTATSDGKYTDGSVAGGIAATRLRAAAFTSIQEELAHIVETTGVSLSVNDTTQVLVALQKLLLTRANPFADIKSDGAAAVAAALANLGLGTAAQRAVGTGANQIPDMNSFTFTGNVNAFVIQLPGGVCIQGGRASTDANGYATVNLGVAMSTYSVIVGEGFVSNWVQSSNLYSALVIYGSQILSSTQFGFRSIWWQGSDKTFRGAPATAQWLVTGRI